MRRLRGDSTAAAVYDAAWNVLVSGYDLGRQKVRGAWSATILLSEPSMERPAKVSNCSVEYGSTRIVARLGPETNGPDGVRAVHQVLVAETGFEPVTKGL